LKVGVAVKKRGKKQMDRTEQENETHRDSFEGEVIDAKSEGRMIQILGVEVRG